MLNKPLDDNSYLSHLPAVKYLAENREIPFTKDITFFVGENGTGKSTLLHMLDALIFPSSGELSAYGTRLTERAMNNVELQQSFRRKVGFVFQNPDIQLFCPTVKEDILFGALQLGLPRQDIQSRFDNVVELMKIGHLIERSPHQLSIGEKKKAAIAGVLILKPEVLLLDEPTAGLDPQTTRDITGIVFDAHKNGSTIVMATHDLHLVEDIADTVHVLGSSRTILRSGTPAKILGDRQFLMENNLLHIRTGTEKVYPPLQ